jgi:hypothetical protein
MEMQSTATRAGAVPLENATRARIRVEHGAGQLIVRPGADPNLLLAGDFGEHAEMDVRREGEEVDVILRPVGSGWQAWLDPTYWWGPRRPYDWVVELSPAVELALEFSTGACRSILDLSGLRVSQVVLNTGMSETELTLPAEAGLTKVDVHSGLADVTIRIPSGVAASIHGDLGLAALNVNVTRFRRVADGYESPDFATATNRVQIHVEGGLESVSVL